MKRSGGAGDRFSSVLLNKVRRYFVSYPRGKRRFATDEQSRST
jgi:hypothetical protein